MKIVRLAQSKVVGNRLRRRE